MSATYSFPQYRRLVNGKSYYLIESAERMTEIGTMGRYWWENAVIAKILPERLLIKDVLDCQGGSWEHISSEEYVAFVKDLKETKEQRSI